MPSSGRPVDEVIAKLTLESGDFQKSAYEAIQTFNQLKSTISGDIKDDLSSMAKGIDELTDRFRFFGTLQQRLMWRVSDSIIDMGQNIFRTATSAIRDGWGEYNTKMGSVMTMKAAGYNIDDITNSLAKLNDYADKTIYSFANMTSAMSQFTTKGIDLETASAAVMGMANAAGMANVGNAELNGALRNLAQSLSMGYMDLRDWRTMDTTQIGGKAFKDTAIKEAITRGIIQDLGNGMYKVLSSGKDYNMQDMFYSALSEKWLTKDVLLGTLKQFSDANTEVGKAAYEATTTVKTLSQLMDTVTEDIGSGWANTFEIVVGNLDEASALFTAIKDEISAVVGPIGDFRNAMLMAWKELHGRDILLSGLKEFYLTFKEIVSAVVNAFNDVFRPNTEEAGHGLLVLSEMIRNVGKAIHSIAKVLATLIGPPLRIIFGIVKVIISPLQLIWNLIRRITNVLEKFSQPLSLIGDLINVILDPFNKLISAIANFDASGITDAFNGIKKLFNPFQEFKGTEIAKKWIRLGTNAGGSNDGWQKSLVFEDQGSLIENWIKENGKKLSYQIRTAFSSLLTLPDGLLKDIGKGGLKVFDALEAFAKGSGGLIAKQLGTIFETLFKIVGLIGGGLWNGLMQVWNVIKKVIKFVAGASGGVIVSVLQMIGAALQGVFEILEFVADTLEIVFKWLGGASKVALDWIVTKLTELWDVLKKFATETEFINTFKLFASSLKTVWSAIKSGNFWDALMEEPIRKGLPNLRNTLIELGTTAAGSAKKGLATLKKFIFSFLPKGVADELDAFGSALWNSVSGPVVTAWEFMVGLVTNFTGTMDEAAVAVQNFLSEHQTLQAILDKVISVIDTVVKKVQQYYGAFKEGGFGKLGSVVWTDMLAAFDVIKNFLSDVPTNAGNFFGGLFESISQFTGGVWDQVTEFFTGLFKTLGSKDVEATITNVAKLAGVIAGLAIAFEGAGLLKALKDVAKAADPIRTIQKLFNSFTGRMLALTALAFGIAAVAKALETLTKIDWQQLLFAAGVIVGVFVAIGLVAKIAGSNLQSLAALGAVGFAFIGLAASLMMIIIAVQMLDETKMGVFQEALITFGLFIAFVGGMSRFMKGGELIKAAVGIFLLGAALLTLVGAVVAVALILQALKASVKPEVFNTALLILAAIAVVMMVLNVLVKGANSTLASAGSLFALAGIIVAVGYVVKQVTALAQDGEDLWGAVVLLGIAMGGMIGLLLALEAVAKAMSENEDAAEKMDSITKTLLSVAASIFAVVAALKIMEMLDMGRAIVDAVILVVVIGVLIFAANKLNTGTAYGLAAIAAVIVALSLSLILLSGIPWQQLLVGGAVILGLAVIIVALAGAVGWIPGVKEGLISLGVALLGLAAVAVVGVVIVAAIAYVIYMIAHSADNLSASDVVNKIHEVVDSIVQYAPQVGADIGRAIGALLAALVIGLVSAIGTAFSILGSAISDAWNSLLGSEGPFGAAARKLQEWFDNIKEAIGGIFEGIADFFSHPLESIADFGSSLFSGDLFKAPEPGDADLASFKDSGSKPYENLKQGVEETAPQAQEAVEQANTDILASFDNLDLSILDDLKNKFTDTFSGIQDAADGAAGLKDQITSALSFDPASMGTQSFDISQMVSFTGGTDLGGGAATEVMGALTGGIEGGLGDVQGSIDMLTSGADEQWAHFDWASTGSHAADGLAAGLGSSNALAKVKSAARALAQAAVDEANATVQSHSPSRVFMRIGGYIWQGFVNGIGDGINRVKSVTQTLAMAAVDTAQTAMDAMSMRPTVTPVLDISNLEKIPGVGNGIEIPIRADIRGLGTDLDNMTSKIVNSNKSVTSKIDALIDKLESVELKIALQPQELDGNVITDTVEEITSIRKLLSDFGKGEA